MNGCITKIEFSCNCYKQTTCKHFEQSRNVPSTCCMYGLFERPCRNNEANEESLNRELQKWNKKVKCPA